MRLTAVCAALLVCRARLSPWKVITVEARRKRRGGEEKEEQLGKKEKKGEGIRRI